MPGLNRSPARNPNGEREDSSGSSDVYASATSNESRGRTKAREPARRGRSSDGHFYSQTPTTKPYVRLRSIALASKFIVSIYRLIVATTFSLRLERTFASRNDGSMCGSSAQERTGMSCKPTDSSHSFSLHLIIPYSRSVQDEITGEILAVKMVTRIFDKLQLAKRALREITLLRHFNNHENVSLDIIVCMAILTHLLCRRLLV